VAWDPRWLRYQWHDDTWWLTTSTGEIQIRPGDGEWCLFTPYGKRKPWECGKWGYLVLDFIFMRDAMFDRSRHSEMLAPVRVGVVPAGTTEEMRRVYAREIEEMRRHAWFVLPPGLEYKIVESTGNVRQVYREMIEDSEADIMIGLTGNKVLVDGTSGFSNGDFQQRVSASMRGFYASTWSDHVHEDGLTPWTADNFPTAEVPRVEYATDPPEDKDAEVKRIGELGDSLTKLSAGLEKLGFEVEDDAGIVSLVERASGLKVRRKPAPLPPMPAAPPALPMAPPRLPGGPFDA
jgi:phage gp29-like protein